MFIFAKQNLKAMRKLGHILENLYACEYSKEINWEFFESIPEFAKLAECKQNPKWHSEGTAWQHTKLAMEKLNTELLNNADEIFFTFNSSEDLLIVRAAVLFHDIGKSVTTFIGKDGNWHSYNHEIEGEKIARVILWNEDFYIRETICSLVRYHMEPLRIFDSKNWVNRMIEIGTRVPWKYLYYVKMADLLGSVQNGVSTLNQDLMKMDLIRTSAMALNIWHDTTSSRDLQPLVKYFNDKSIFPWKLDCEGQKPIAVIMIGLPGSGKNTWIEKYSSLAPDAVHLSRDDIRIELGYCKPGEKYLGTKEEEDIVTEVYDKKLNAAIKEKRNVILNNVHLKKKYREISVNLLRKVGYHIEFVYVEAPTLEDNYSRRDNQINSNIINNMALSFEWPETGEYDSLIISKQSR